MKSLTLAELDTLSAVDIKTVDPEQLVDIRDISIHTELPREERVLDFIRQIRNPYCFRHGKIVVKILSMTVRPAKPIHTARQTRKLHMMPRKMI